MTVHLQADTAVVNDLLARFPFTSFNSIVQARVELAQQIRLSMQYPQTYQIPLDQHLPAEQGLEAIAQYVHPWNVACALMNVCLNGTRFGGDNLAPQEDLQVYVGEWKPLMGCTFPSAIVPAQQAPITAAPAPAPEVAVPPVMEALGHTQPPAPVADTPVHTSAAPQQPQQHEVVSHGDSVDLPDSDIKLERSGQTGRPQKSPFEKKIEERSKIADPPFWWKHLLISAPKIFRKSPAGALDDSSSGAGPVQSYMVLVALLRQVLDGVDPRTSVAALRTFLAEIDEQVSKLESAAAANQLRDTLVPKRK